MVRFVLFLALLALGCVSVFCVLVLIGGGFTPTFKHVMQIAWLPSCVVVLGASLFTAEALPCTTNS